MALCTRAALVGCLLLFGLAWTRSAHAAPRNQYGKAGRTIVSTSAHGSRSNLTVADPVGRDATWTTMLHLTALHFVVDNVAIGGTFDGGLQNLRQLHESPSSRWLALDLDGVYHVPLSARLSLRFWVWVGLRAAHTRELSYELVDNQLVGVPERPDRALAVAIGLSPSLLVHLSSSLALEIGPGLDVRVPLRASEDVGVGLRATARMTYSFGPDPETQQRLQDARRFGARGRNLLAGSVLAANGIGAAVSYARFVRQGIAVGSYLNAGGHIASSNADFWVGAGIQAVGSVALLRALGVLVIPSLGYAWRGYTDNDGRTGGAHVLIGDVSAYLGMHLYDGLFIGIGPRVSTQLRLATLGPHLPNPYYVEGGLGSALLASF